MTDPISDSTKKDTDNLQPRVATKLPQFDRRVIDSDGQFTCIGSGSIGGKAQGLAYIRDGLLSRLDKTEFPSFIVEIPTLTVLATSVFDAFMQRNNLFELAYSETRDDKIGAAFQHADFPAEIVGDIRAISERIKSPLAVRSSSMFEDALREPFAGVYATKMVPNNQFDPDSRFRVLIEAIKFVFASTFFREAKEYMRSNRLSIQEEKMAVIIQAVAGTRHGERYYPHISGVARSFNYYPTGKGKSEEGVVNLALGLGKTIVDGGLSWSYCPAYPKENPPYKSNDDLLDNSQTEFFAVNMGKPPEYDPIHENEYLVTANLRDAEEDEVLTWLASTYLPQDDRFVVGLEGRGPRVLTFAPILVENLIPLNKLIKALLKICETEIGHEVEIEFAATIASNLDLPSKFSFLQVRPMMVSRAEVMVEPEEMESDHAFISTESILGNGEIKSIKDIIYLKTSSFTEAEAWKIVSELEDYNHRLVSEGRPYLLIVYGRLGTTDPPFGIPVSWWQVAGAKVIIEVAAPEMGIELSQGSHFFHNIISSQVGYFSIRRAGAHRVDWDWLNSNPVAAETEFIRHVKLENALTVRIDGKRSRGVISR